MLMSFNKHIKQKENKRRGVCASAVTFTVPLGPSGSPAVSLAGTTLIPAGVFIPK